MAITKKIEIEHTKLDKEIQAARNAYERRPKTWRGNEALGRVLHWVDDPTAAGYIQKAIELRFAILDEERVRGWEYIAIGIYYRLADEPDNAHTFFQKAYDKLKLATGDVTKKIKFQPLQYLGIVCFLLEKYEEAVMYGKLLHEEEPDPQFIPWQFALRADAILSNDIVQMQAFVNDDAKRLQNIAGRGQFCETAFITLLDKYSISLEILNKMETANEA